jgi:nitrogen fixation-related uncharacterized protein
MPEIISIKEIGIMVVITIAVLFTLGVGIFLWGMAYPQSYCDCTVSNESALQAAYQDGYHDGLATCEAGNDTPGWSWNYTTPEWCV